MTQIEDHPTRMRVPRSRGAVTGLLLVILGFWGALIPFIGPRFEFAYSPGEEWTAARGWLEVLPGTVTVLAGLLLIVSTHRAVAMLGGWMAALSGAWFVVGTTVAPLLNLGSAGDPVAITDRKRAALEISYFSGLGVLIVFLAGAVLARLAVRLARDVHPVPAAGPSAPVEPSREPYFSGLEEPARGDEAVTEPAVGPVSPPAQPRRTGAFRRHRAGV